MKKYILGAVFSLGLLVSPIFASPVQAAGLTSQQITSILSLLRSFGADQTVIDNVWASLTGGTPATEGQSWCHTFNTNLGIGTRSAEVAALQTALSRSGNDTGNGSSDLTPLFDEQVAGAVVQFQAKYRISQTGVVGPMTRAKLNALYGCNEYTAPTPIYLSVSPSTVVQGQSYTYTGTISNAAPNSPIYFTVQQPDGSFLSKDWFPPTAPTTDANGNATITQLLPVYSNAQLGQWMIWVTIGGKSSQKSGVWVSSSAPTITSTPIVTFIGTPTLRLQYDSTQHESALVGNATYTITAGNSPVTFDNYNSTSKPYVLSFNGSGTWTITGPSVIQAGQTASYTATLNANPKVMFAGSYRLQTSNLGYAVNGQWYNVPSTSFINAIINADPSNTVTIVGEVSPYISSIVSDLAGNASIKGVRLAGGSINYNGVTKSYSVINSQDGSYINFKPADFGVTRSLTAQVQIMNSSVGNSNIVWFNYTAPTPTSLTNTQIQSILSLLSSFGASSIARANVSTILYGGTVSTTNLAPSGLTSSQVQSILSLLSSFGASSSMITNIGTVLSASATPAASITVISPNGGEAWKVGETHTIQWTSQGANATNYPVQIGIIDTRYSTESGARSEQTIGNSVTNTGSYSWTIPQSIQTMNFGDTYLPVYKIIIHSMSDSFTGHVIAGLSSSPFAFTATAVNSAPTVALGANPLTIIAGQSSTLTLSTTNADSCSITGRESNTTNSVWGVYPNQTTTYSATCSNAAGSTTKSVTVTVNQPNTSAQTATVSGLGYVGLSGINSNMTAPANTNTALVGTGSPAGSMINVSVTGTSLSYSFPIMSDGSWNIGLGGFSAGSYPFIIRSNSNTGSILANGTLTITSAPTSNNKPTGVIDTASSGVVGTCGNVAGWAYDADNVAASTEINLYVDGVPGTGAGFNAGVTTGSRPDVNTYFGITGIHGYNYQIPNLSVGNHTVYAYSHGVDTAGTMVSEPVLLVNSPMSFVCNPAPLSLIGGSNQMASALGALSSATQVNAVQTTTNPGFSYSWNRNLEIGSSYTEDVKALQTALTHEGVYTGEISGGFYNQTFSAVKAFQQKYGIDTGITGAGFVGSKTREKLNTLY